MNRFAVGEGCGVRKQWQLSNKTDLHGKPYCVISTSCHNTISY